MEEHDFFDRDISWLSFNERVLMEAGKEEVPLAERLKFLSIFSSNLDEFYRVRIPVLMALRKIQKKEKKGVLKQVKATIDSHQQQYGHILSHEIIPALRKEGTHFLYNEPIPEYILSEVNEIFFARLQAFLQPVFLSENQTFFPENNKIYFAAVIQKGKKKGLAIINIPSDHLPRFYTVPVAGKTYVVLIDDILKQNMHHLFAPASVKEQYSFKVTRDADLGLKDEYTHNIARKIEKLLTKRDFGFATRLLYDAAMPDVFLQTLADALRLTHATKVAGGRYHNLKDLISFPLNGSEYSYKKWGSVSYKLDPDCPSIFDQIDKEDIMLHTPYHNYNIVLRFFNEAVIDPSVEEIYITLYRIAHDSAIAYALMSAAKNGKKVTVFVELKARFDEANNIRWAKKMKAAGVKIIYSIPGLKVHAKTALISRKNGDGNKYYGLLSTGNFNENTAKLYTDHALLTAHQGMLKELQSLFNFLSKRKKPGPGPLIQPTGNDDKSTFIHLLVAQFNLKDRFLSLIDREIAYTRQGRKASLTIKLNNLEDEGMISKLYEASKAGVHIDLIVRSICRLVPGVKGVSENITVRRIVDRYLEHGRIFIFHNGGDEEIYSGSADWMKRNIYNRIEVCFPIYDERIKAELKRLIGLQLADNVQAVTIGQTLRNRLIVNGKEKIRSQYAIHKMIAS